MAAEKQGMYPPAGENPPAYPGGPGPAAPGPQQPPPGGYAAPPPGGYVAPPPGAYPPGQGPPYQTQYNAPPGSVPPPGGYIVGQPVVVGQPMGQQVVIVQQHMFRQSPVNTVCPHCSQNIITSTNAEAGGLTWLLCAGICLFGFWLGCCLIPFCIDDCQDIRHSCPNCKNTIHVFRRL